MSSHERNRRLIVRSTVLVVVLWVTDPVSVAQTQVGGESWQRLPAANPQQGERAPGGTTSPLPTAGPPKWRSGP